MHWYLNLSVFMEFDVFGVFFLFVFHVWTFVLIIACLGKVLPHDTLCCTFLWYKNNILKSSKEQQKLCLVSPWADSNISIILAGLRGVFLIEPNLQKGDILSHKIHGLMNFFKISNVTSKLCSLENFLYYACLIFELWLHCSR